MKKTFLLLMAVMPLVACSSDDGAMVATPTNATITLKNTAGNAVPNITVYAYSEDTWDVIGENTLFADYQAASNDQGNARFANIDSPDAFTVFNNYQNTFRFAVHYSLNDLEKTKVVAITFNQGESKSANIILN